MTKSQADLYPTELTAWLKTASPDELVDRAHDLVDHFRARDWITRLDSARLPDLAAIFALYATPADLRQALERIQIILVLTSHPSELRPMPVLRALAAVPNTIDETELTAQLRPLLPKVPHIRPTVAHEVAALAEHIDRVLFAALPAHLLRVIEAARTVFGADAPQLPLTVRFHTWVGGDRDGNPAVTAAETLAAGARFRNCTLAGYRETLRQVFGQLEPRVQAELEKPFSVLDTELSRSAFSVSGFRPRVLALLEMLQQRQLHAATDALNALVGVLDTCGSHVAALEWRENGGLILQADHESRDENAVAHQSWSPATRDLFDSLRALARLREDSGSTAVAALIISNCENADMVVALERLARACGVFASGIVPIVPLFESIAALRHAPTIVEAILDAPTMREYFQPPHNTIEVMLGYSDAAKDGGRLMADFEIRHAQTAIVAVCRLRGINVRFFHGRGGTPARGQADIAEALAEHIEPWPGVHFKQTEQGEVVANRYGHPHLAAVTLDTWLAQALLHDRLQQKADRGDQPLVARLIEDAHAAYRALREEPRFLDHLSSVTPLAAVCRLPLSSRPAARVDSQSHGSLTLERLRAIPLNLAANASWVQAPSWYGTGWALERELTAHGVQALLATYRDSAALRFSLARAAQGLALTDFSLLRQRAAASRDAELCSFVEQLATEAKRVRDAFAMLQIPIAHGLRTDTFHERKQRELQLALAIDPKPLALDFEHALIAATAAMIGMSG